MRGAALLQWIEASWCAGRTRMRCPKCQFDHELQTTECLKCGIVFSRYEQALERAAEQAEPVASAAPVPLFPSVVATVPEDAVDAVREFQCRVLALPLALILARLVVGTGLRLVAGMLAMVVHESGHAISAWLTGRWAVPLLWVTPHGEDRSWAIVLLVTAAIVFGGFLAWKAQRWGWVVAAGAALLVQLIFLTLPAGATIVFCGDGGAMVLATMLMATFYAPRESALYRSWGLRWGLLLIGALSFMHVFLLWTGPFADLPFGEIEGVGPSDPSLLTVMYGWSVTQLIDRYVRLGTICLVALSVLYVWGLVSTYLEIPASDRQRVRRFGKLPRVAE
jgi:hypothetical protein